MLQFVYNWLVQLLSNLVTGDYLQITCWTRWRNPRLQITLFLQDLPQELKQLVQRWMGWKWREGCLLRQRQQCWQRRLHRGLRSQPVTDDRMEMGNNGGSCFLNHLLLTTVQGRARFRHGKNGHGCLNSTWLQWIHVSQMISNKFVTMLNSRSIQLTSLTWSANGTASCTASYPVW